MKQLRSIRATTAWLAIIATTLSGQVQGQNFDPEAAVGLRGGPVVQLGASEVTATAGLSLTGRYLIHVLERDTELVQRSRSRLRKDGHYVVAWVEDPVEELFRVLTPGGTLGVANPAHVSASKLEAGGFDLADGDAPAVIVRKPWPSEMGHWS